VWLFGHYTEQRFDDGRLIFSDTVHDLHVRRRHHRIAASFLAERQFAPQQRLYSRPEPQGQAPLRPGLSAVRTRWERLSSPSQ